MTAANGLRVPTMAVPFDDTQFSAMLEHIVKGLALVEFNIRLDDSVSVNVITATKIASVPLFQNMLGKKSAAKAQRTLVRGAETYECAQGVDDAHVIVWLIELMGGLSFPKATGKSIARRLAR